MHACKSIFFFFFVFDYEYIFFFWLFLWLTHMMTISWPQTSTYEPARRDNAFGRVGEARRVDGRGRGDPVAPPDGGVRTTFSRYGQAPPTAFPQFPSTPVKVTPGNQAGSRPSTGTTATAATAPAAAVAPDVSKLANTGATVTPVGVPLLIDGLTARDGQTVVLCKARKEIALAEIEFVGTLQGLEADHGSPLTVLTISYAGVDVG